MKMELSSSHTSHSFTSSRSPQERVTSRHFGSCHMPIKLSKNPRAFLQKESQFQDFRHKTAQELRRHMLKQWVRPGWISAEHWQHVLWPISCTTQIQKNSFHPAMASYRSQLVINSEDKVERHGSVERALAIAVAKAVADPSSSPTTHSQHPSFLMSSVLWG